jgi:hypothetical protein
MRKVEYARLATNDSYTSSPFTHPSAILPLMFSSPSLPSAGTNYAQLIVLLEIGEASSSLVGSNVGRRDGEVRRVVVRDRFYRPRSEAEKPV